MDGPAFCVFGFISQAPPTHSSVRRTHSSLPTHYLDPAVLCFASDKAKGAQWGSPPSVSFSLGSTGVCCAAQEACRWRDAVEGRWWHLQAKLFYLLYFIQAQG